MKICRIGVHSLSKIYALIFGGFGILIGLGIGGTIAVRQHGAIPRVHPAIEAVAAIIITPFAYALLGFILGIIAAVLFNFAAKVTGGLEIEVVKEGAGSGQ